MSLSINTNNYHYTSATITDYSKEYLEKSLKEANFTVTKLECDASIMQKMSRPNILFIVDATIEKDGKKIYLESLDNFSDFSEIDAEYRDTISEIFKRYVERAIEDNKHHVMIECESTEKNKDELTKEKPKTKQQVKSQEKEIKLYLTCKHKDAIAYITKLENVALWTQSNYKKTETGFLYYSNLYFNDLIIKEESLSCEMVFEPLKINSEMNINFVGDDFGTTVQITFKKVDISILPIVENLLLDQIFNPISHVFRLKVTQLTAFN